MSPELRAPFPAAPNGRDHGRNLGAGTFTAKLGSTRLVLHQILGMHPALHRRFLADALRYLTTFSRPGPGKCTLMGAIQEG